MAALELKPRAHLTLPGNLGAGGHAERRPARSICIHPGKVHAIQDIEEINSKIELNSLRNAGDLLESCVDLCKPGIAKLIHIFVTLLAKLREGERAAGIQVRSRTMREQSLDVILAIVCRVISGHIGEVIVITIRVEVAAPRLILIVRRALPRLTMPRLYRR